MRTNSNDPFLPETLGVKNSVKMKQTGDRLMVQCKEYYHHWYLKFIAFSGRLYSIPSLKQMASKATMQVSNSKKILVSCVACVYGNKFFAKGCLFSAIGIKSQEWSHITSPMKKFKNTNTFVFYMEDLETMFHYEK